MYLNGPLYFGSANYDTWYYSSLKWPYRCVRQKGRAGGASVPALGNVKKK